MIDTKIFLGMEKRQSQNKAEQLNLIYRLIKVDGKEFFSYPEKNDTREDRICIEIDKGRVTKATIQ